MAEMTPEVTAVITTHGRPQSVQRAIASVLGGTFRNIELVIVDDGGGFDCSAVDSDLPLRVVRGVGLGVGRARNLGLSAALGEFIIFLDDDDVALPNRISSLLGAARRHHAGLCFGMTRRVVNGLEVLERVPTHLPAPGPVGFCDVLACAPHVNAVLVQTEMLRAVGGFDTGAKRFDDWSAWLRIADRNVTMWSIAEPVAEWRIHARGLSGRVLRTRAMKTRLLSLFERLEESLSEENARALAMARRVVASADIITYDDYADVMAAVRAQRP